MSSPSGSDWWRPQLYHQDLSNQEISNRSMFDGDQGYEEATVVSGSAGRANSSGGGGGGGHLSPEGRVGKPAARRRTRASRRTPTTVFNTDTKNFRAMVQQFTGAGAGAGGHTSAPFEPEVHPGDGPHLGFGIGSRQPHVNPGSLMAAPPVFHLQYQHQHQQPQFQHQNQPYMFSLNSNNPGARDLLLQRLGGNPRPNMESGSDGFVSGGVPSQFPPTNNFLQ